MKTNYDTDFYTWTQQQAELLKAGRFSELDIENIAEELETMGRSEKRELESRLAVLMVHLLKWQYQPERRGRSWELTIKAQRIELAEVIDDNPGLKLQMPDLIKQAYRKAKVLALRQTRLDDSILPDFCPWTLAQLQDETFFSE